MILLIDNFDSFVHNLARYLGRMGHATRVVRNNAIDVARIRALRPAALIISPGPCTPNEAGVSLDVVRALHTEFPILGVCLGHQTIAAALGGEIIRAPQPMHGRTSPILHNGQGILAGLPSPFTACRYHSLIVNPQTLPDCLDVTARTPDGIVMAVQHRRLPTVGVQFHPEAVLTDHGYLLLANFLRLAGLTAATMPTLDDERRFPADRVPLAPSPPITF